MGLFWAMALLFMSGFFILDIIGMQWTLAMDFGARKLAGTAVAMYNGFNYLGVGFQGILIRGILHWSGGDARVRDRVSLLATGAVLMFLARR